MKRVLLVSKFNWDAPAELPYVFTKASYGVDVFSPPGSWLSSNSFMKNHIVASSNELEFLSELLALIKQVNYDWILLTEDPLIELFKREIEDENLLEQLLPVKNKEARDILSSKIGFSTYFQSIGIDTPAYVGFQIGFNILNDLNILRFPVLNKYDLSWGGSDMAISHDLIELKIVLENLPKHAKLLIQEFIEGDEIRVDALFYNGRLLNYFCAEVLSHTKDQFSYTTRRSYYAYPELSRLLESIGKNIVAHGFANISFIRQKHTHKHYLIEIDLRPNSWMAYSRFLSKQDFVYCLKHLHESDKFSFIQSSLKVKNSIELALFYKDIRRAIWAKDWKGIVRWIVGWKGYWRYLPFYDFKLTKKIVHEIWVEVVVFKFRKMKQKLVFRY
jgi:hypothetical protein